MNALTKTEITKALKAFQWIISKSKPHIDYEYNIEIPDSGAFEGNLPVQMVNAIRAWLVANGEHHGWNRKGDVSHYNFQLPDDTHYYHAEIPSRGGKLRLSFYPGWRGNGDDDMPEPWKSEMAAEEAA